METADKKNRHERRKDESLARKEREKSVDELAMDFRNRLMLHLHAVGEIMDEAAKNNFEISFNVRRNELGRFAPVDVGLLRRY